MPVRTVVDLLDRSLKQGFEVFEIGDFLVSQLTHEPPAQDSMVGFDFSLSFWITGYDVVAVDAEFGQTLAEDMGAKGRSPIELEAYRQAKLLRGKPKYSDCRWNAFRWCDDRRQNSSAVVIKYRENVNADTGTLAAAC